MPFFFFLVLLLPLGWNFKRSIHDYEFYAYLPTNPLRRNLMKVVVSKGATWAWPNFPYPPANSIVLLFLLWLTWLSVGCFGACLRLPLALPIYY